MTVLQLPDSPVELANATWEDIAPRYQELADQPLSPETMGGWLAAWSTLDELVTEAAGLAMIAYTADTSDPAKQAAHLRFSAEILPKADEQGVLLSRRLLSSGYSRPDLETTLRRFRTTADLFREANVPLFSQLEGLGARYQQVTGTMTAEWDGVKLPVPQLQPFLKSNDRAIRERAFRAIGAPYIAARDSMAAVFNEMRELRQQLARNAGFDNFRDYVFPAKFRFDYGASDCERFHDAVEAKVVPAIERMMARRRQRLGLPELRPWDLLVSPDLPEPLRPFRTSDEFSAKALLALAQVDPELGAEFALMRDERLLDLESRAGKAPGGYCETLHHRGRPFIFMNAVGVDDDVMTLMHEAGHAFHAFASHPLPLIWQRHPGSEAAELASMSMELLAAPYLGGPGGFFAPEEARFARIDHLEDILVTLAHVASVDAFQHWIYTAADGQDAAARDAMWIRIRNRFDRGADWSGLEQDRVARWYRQLHIFLYPFYYIEYGIAQLGALQVWRNSLADRPGAVSRYRSALALGATRPLPEVYRAAGARLVFDAEGIGELVEVLESEVERLRSG